MEGSHSVTDSTDWLSTSIPLFAPVDNALRCQVCKDFFETPVITSCSHTFCSLCIRRCLSADGKCPACRSSDQASKLRRNWTVEEIVASFQAARPSALDLATRRAQEEPEDADGVTGGRARKRRRTSGRGDETESNPSSSQRQTRSRAKQQTNGASPPSTQVVVLDDDERDKDYAEPDDGLVHCPLCNARMKEALVFSHLDRCDGTSHKQQQSNSRALLTSLAKNIPPRPPSTHPPQQQERLAELNYSLLTEPALRRKLKELGVPNTGNKPLMTRRHTEWVNLWNSNVDSSRPRTKRELLTELDGWERAQGGLARESHGSVNGIMKKEWDSDGYRRAQGIEFERLIAEARAKRGRPPEATAGEAEDTQRTADSRDVRDQPGTAVEETRAPEVAVRSQALAQEAPQRAEHLDYKPQDVLRNGDVHGPAANESTSRKVPMFTTSPGQWSPDAKHADFK